MKSTSTLSRQKIICEALQQCRQRTLDLCKNLDQDILAKHIHPDFSPVGWHLGHIAYTEAYWILSHCAGLSSTLTKDYKLFATDGIPKHQRHQLPSLELVSEYLHLVRAKVLSYLEIAPLAQQERLWYWLISHESQHYEIIATILQLHYLQAQELARKGNQQHHNSKSFPFSSLSEQMIAIPAGEFQMGSNAIHAQDNESPQHTVYLEQYYIDPYPVTRAQYRQFILAGGYQNSQWWSKLGWQWLQKQAVTQPLYWRGMGDDVQANWDNHPVCGVSWYEAQAYANYVGKRLPTEAQWEKAAQFNFALPRSNNCNYDNLVGHTTPVDAYSEGKSIYGCYDMLGNVWEWTNSWFECYRGFSSYPHPDYSQIYFGYHYRVLRGGSWVTPQWILRPSFRGWYKPGCRQLFFGFRCAK